MIFFPIDNLTFPKSRFPDPKFHILFSTFNIVLESTARNATLVQNLKVDVVIERKLCVLSFCVAASDFSLAGASSKFFSPWFRHMFKWLLNGWWWPNAKLVLIICWPRTRESSWAENKKWNRLGRWGESSKLKTLEKESKGVSSYLLQVPFFQHV